MQQRPYGIVVSRHQRFHIKHVIHGPARLGILLQERLHELQCSLNILAHCSNTSRVPLRLAPRRRAGLLATQDLRHVEEHAAVLDLEDLQPAQTAAMPPLTGQQSSSDEPTSLMLRATAAVAALQGQGQRQQQDEAGTRVSIQ